MKAIIRDILKWTASRHPELDAQIDHLVLESHEHTGCGLYAHFKPLPDGTRAIGLASPINGPEVEGPGIEFGACSLVWLKNGMITAVEIAAYGDKFPDEPAGYRLKERLQNQASQDTARNLADPGR